MNEPDQKYVIKNNSGSLFRNNNKVEETHADYKGSCNIEGKEYWINAWVNTSQKGTKYFGIKFNVKESRPEIPQNDGGALPADEVPF